MGVSARAVLRDCAAVVRSHGRAVRGTAVHAPAPPLTGQVMEVGGGQAPHPRSDVVVEKYVVDDFERPGGAPLDLSKPLIVADGQHLPFADGSFAYSIASHVLEHATDPVGFARELSRVSSAGFVQVPSRQSELTFGWPFHPWLIDRVGEGLRFEAKGTRTAPLGELFHRSWEREPLFRLWWSGEPDRWLHSLHWREGFDVTVDGPPGTAEATSTLDLEQLVAVLEQITTPPLPETVWSGLRCPLSGGELTRSGDWLRCEQSGLSYPVVGRVPVLLQQAAVSAA